MLREGLQAKKHSLKPAVTIVTLQDGSKWEEEHQGARQRCLTVDSPQQDREPFFVEGKEDPIPYKVGLLNLSREVWLPKTLYLFCLTC